MLYKFRGIIWLAVVILQCLCFIFKQSTLFICVAIIYAVINAIALLTNQHQR